jgi:hypothetical protein
VSGAVKQSWAIGHTMQMVVELIHVLTGQQESNHGQYAEYYMGFLHVDEDLQDLQDFAN